MPEGVDCPFDQYTALRVVGNIGRLHQPPGAARAAVRCNGFQAIGGTCGEHQMRFFPAQLAREFGANALRCARDDDDPAGEGHAVLQARARRERIIEQASNDINPLERCEE